MECEHGTDIGTPGGRDRLCTLCETDFPLIVEPGDVWIVAGHTHALEKAAELEHESGLRFTVRVKDQDEYRRVGAAKCHYEVLVDPDHDHVWGEVESSRLAGTPHRKCVVEGCRDITLDLSDDEDPEDEDEDAPVFRLTIHHDDYPHDAPDEDDTLYKVHSFNSDHRSFTHPDEVLACMVCGDARDAYQHTDVPQENDEVFKYADWAKEFRDENPEDLHEYQMREGFPLSYFEHGNCRWGLMGTMSGMPDFRWDGVQFAGFLEVTLADDEDRTWYDSKTDEEKTEMAAGFMEYYTSWCNGEIYGYVLERINFQVCNLGQVHEFPTDEDSCWGFIGWDNFQDAVREATINMRATEQNTEVVDKAYGMAEYGTFFQDDDEPKGNE